MNFLWIPVTIAAAFFQNLRSSLQRHLKGKLSDMGVTYVRFAFAWPFAVIWLALPVPGSESMVSATHPPAATAHGHRPET
jgi:hypothetical protein